MRIAVFFVIILILAVAVGTWLTAARVETLRKDGASFREQVSQLREEIRGLGTSSMVPNADAPLPQVEEQGRTAGEVEEMIRKLGSSPTARDMATCLYELDMWAIRPEEEQRSLGLKQELASRLRRQVAMEVRDKQNKSLVATTGGHAIELHGEAGQILALYPMSDDQGVLKEAKVLSAQQVEIAIRIDVLRRQRYNQWACKQIEAAIDGYTKSSSYWNPMKENRKLMDSLVTNLGEIDPGLIEPAVMELYTYVLDLTKKSISQNESIELAKRLTDPDIRRKTLGDF